MASFTTNWAGDGDVRYVVNYRDPDGAQRCKTFRRKAEADAFRTAVELRLRVHVLPELGRPQLRQIKPSTIQRWLRTLDGLATTYRRVIYDHVSSVLTAAVDDDLIAKNPCKAGSVDKPSTARRKLTPWTAEMVTAMYAALPPHYRPHRHPRRGPRTAAGRDLRPLPR